MIKIKKEGKALVILSGGQDSTTCLYYALEYFDKVEAITFFYGQNHAVEVECAKEICAIENVKQTLVDISFLPNLVDSAMLSGGNTSEIGPKGLPTSFVPNRNALFITLAHAYAQKIGADTLITGVCQTDYSGYPDCRRMFVNLIDSALNYGAQADIVLDTPMMYLTKAETFEMAYDLEVLDEIIRLTHTCYKGDRTVLNEWGYGCGECPACVLRKEGYEDFKAML